MYLTICDDQKSELEAMQLIVSDYAAAHPELSITVQCFLNPSELLDVVSKNGAPDIALLDICMPGVLGTDVAKELKEKSDGAADIIFLTTSTDFAVEAFALHAEDYLLKPFSKEKLTETLDRAIEKRKKCFFVPFSCGREIHRVDLYHVAYLESKNHIVEIYLKSGKKMKMRDALAEIKQQFSGVSGFLSVGASYFVNLRCVQSVLPAELILTNGHKIPVPRRFRSEVKEQYFAFYRGEATKH